MKMRILNIVVLVFSCAVLTAGEASAQQPSPAAPLQIQELESGFVVTPDARVTELNNRTGTLAGVYAGWLTDRKLLVGGGAYWLANRADDFKMKYAGGLVRWNLWARRPIGLSTGAFVGVGDATLSRTYGDVFGIPEGTTLRAGRRHGVGQVVTSDTLLRVNDNFFVIAEPQVNALWNIRSWMRIDAGVGYRFIGASDVLGRQLRGVSGSVGLQFGGR